MPDEDAVAVEAYVTVRNLGTRLLEIDHVYSRVQAFDLTSKRFNRLLRMDGRDYQNALTIAGGAPEKLFKSTELPWPQLKFFDRDINHQLEPGETDLITISFVLSCPIVRYVRVATDVSRPETSSFWNLWSRDEASKHAMAWKARTIVDLQPGCPPLTKEEEE